MESPLTPFKPASPEAVSSVLKPVSPAPASQETTVDDAALTIYQSLIDVGFSSEDKIAVIRLISGNVKDEIQQKIQELGKLKQSF